MQQIRERSFKVLVLVMVLIGWLGNGHLQAVEAATVNLQNVKSYFSFFSASTPHIESYDANITKENGNVYLVAKVTVVSTSEGYSFDSIGYKFTPYELILNNGSRISADSIGASGRTIVFKFLLDSSQSGRVLNTVESSGNPGYLVFEAKYAGKTQLIYLRGSGLTIESSWFNPSAGTAVLGKSTVDIGSYARFGGKTWYLIADNKLLYANKDIKIAFHGNSTDSNIPTMATIYDYLNNTFVNSLSNNNWVVLSTWNMSNQNHNEARTITKKVGLLTRDESLNHNSLLLSILDNNVAWTSTFIGNAYSSNSIYTTRPRDENNAYHQTVTAQEFALPVLVLKPGLTIVSGDGSSVAPYILTDNTVPSLILSSPADNQTLSEVPGYNKLKISGTVKDQDVGDTLTIKYQIDSAAAKSIQTVTATGATQPITDYDIVINASIPEGAHVIKVWAEDDKGGMSSVETRSFTVDKTPPAQPVLVENPPGKAPSKQITITYSGDSAVKEYQIGTGAWTVYTGSFTIKQNGTITARATDAAGNISTKSIVITNINPPDPIVTVSNVTNTGLTVTDTGTYTDPVEYQFDLYVEGSATLIGTYPSASTWQDGKTFTFTELNPNVKYRAVVRIRYK